MRMMTAWESGAVLSTAPPLSVSPQQPSPFSDEAQRRGITCLRIHNMWSRSHLIPAPTLTVPMGERRTNSRVGFTHLSTSPLRMNVLQDS